MTVSLNKTLPSRLFPKPDSPLLYTRYDGHITEILSLISKIIYRRKFLFFQNATTPSWPRPPLYRGFTITLNDIYTLGRTLLDEWSARRRDIYLTTHNTHNRQTSIPQAVFEPTIPASKRTQTHVLERAHRDWNTSCGKLLTQYDSDWISSCF